MLNETRRKTILLSGSILGGLLFPNVLFARKKEKKIIIWENPKIEEEFRKKLFKLYQRPYNGVLFLNYLKYLSDFDKKLSIDKKNVQSVLFFNIHIFSKEIRTLTEKAIKILFWETSNKKEKLNKKLFKAIEEHKKKLPSPAIIKTNEQNISKSENKIMPKDINDTTSILEGDNKEIQQKKTDKEETLKDILEKVKIRESVLHYAGYSYLALNNLYLFKDEKGMLEVLKKLKTEGNRRRLSLRELYLKNLWFLFQNNTNKKLNIVMIKKQISEIEKYFFRISFEKQKRKFKDKKFYYWQKKLFKKRKYENYTEEHFMYAYLLSLLSFYYSLIGYNNYSILFLNKIKEKFLISKDIKTIMFYFYINLLGFFLSKNFDKAIDYFKTILTYEGPFLGYKELGFLIYSRSSINAYNNGNYKSAWEYATYAIKYGVTLNPIDYLNDVILMKKILKKSSEEYISFLKEGNNIDLINYVKKETLHILSLTF